MKKTNPLSVAEIEKYANNLRKEFGVSLDSPFPILAVIEKFHYDGLLTIQVLDDSNPLFEDDTPAKYNPKENYIYIKESVLAEIENHEYRASFTLAHELFHYFQFQVLDFKFEDVEKCLTYEDPEWQANEFAGQLLIPTKYVAEEYDLEFISNTFNVSEVCVATRKLKHKKRKERMVDKSLE